MIGFRLDMAKTRFLDTRSIMDPAEKAQLSMLSKVIARTRLRAKRSIRTRKRTATEGNPPSSHTGLLRDFIFYFVDREKKSGIAGPILLNKSDGTAPRALEYGGDFTRRRHANRKEQVFHYREFPYMQPAFEKELERAPEELRDSIKR